MLEKIKTKLKTTPKHVWILIGIILVGIFLRTYNFHDWLRFNADQSRDATLVGQVLEGKESWPMLGPKAGGTNFRLGAAFYYLEIGAAKIFGNYPDKMAYPDLFFSILSIPLLFFLLKKYFTPKLSVALTGLYAFSFYAVKYSRFAWNPNSAPFWTMLFLYALLEIFDSSEGPFDKLRVKNIMWAVAAGMAVGIGVQLHTFLLVVMPLITIGYFAYLAIKGNNLWKNFVMVFLISIFLNMPQLYNEIKTGGENAKALFKGAEVKKENKSLLAKIGRTGECFMTANAFTISSLGSADECDFLTTKSKNKAIDVILGGLLFLGGMGLGIWRLKTEPDGGKRRFLGLILAYTASLFIFMVPVAYEITLRYFLILAFLPFVLLGLWLEFWEKKIQKYGFLFYLTLIVILAGINLRTVQQNFSTLADYTRKTEMRNFDNVYLGELEAIARYIIENADGQDVFLGGNGNYLFKASKSLAYLTGQAGAKLSPLDKNKNSAGAPVFYLVSTESKDKTIRGLDAKYEFLGAESFGRFSVLKLKNKN